MVEPLSGSLAFLIEADRLKRINRQSRLIGGGRRENSAEHSWHLALFALIIGRERPINILKTLKMLLIHDLVEIDAGDTPLHGNSEAKQAQLSAEIAAAHRIFGLLPPDAQAEYLALWDEFETGESDEACFARALDRLQPLIGNLANNGGTWNENGVDEVTVLEHYGRPISTALPDLWPEIRGWVAGHFKTGPASGVRSISQR